MLRKYSEAKNWEDAKQEWRLNHIWYADTEDARTCECGHYPICEICVVENEVNGTILEIGNCCVNQISPEFDALKRIFPALRDGRINPAIIDYAFKQRIINDWEKRFLRNVWRKYGLTSRQSDVFDPIRYRIYEHIRISPKQRQAIYRKWGIISDGATEAIAKGATAQ